MVNNQLKSNATAQRFGKVVTAKASLDIKPTPIIRRIPGNVPFDNKLADMKHLFGSNNKVLLDISGLYGNVVNFYQIEHGISFHVFGLQSYTKAISNVITTINQMSAKKPQMI